MRSIGNIRELASQLLEDSGFSGVYPVPVDKIISSKGYQLKGIDRKYAPEGFSGLVDHEKKLVVINSSHSSGRKRFTAAHELGHIVLHPDSDEVDYRISSSASEPKEVEANRFAAEILMPYEDFLNIYSQYPGRIDSVANYFGVSTAAVTIRAESLNLTG
jgi:Zn-dependent peptidase ImmA (M78 family)